MAILHRKEEKIQVVLGRLPKKYTHEEFVQMFIKLYSKDWGKIKSAYIKQNQDREPGTVVNMPKPELYLQQLLDTYLATAPSKNVANVTSDVKTEEKSSAKAKSVAKKKEETPATKTKAAPKKQKEENIAPTEEIKKKATAKKKVAAEKPTVAKKSKSADK
ncbi:MAG: hypothetical protein REI64_11320 [Pedobacter sp.]|uniref:hypothetical protein n=1 Tax=Pedobacter sp. TaxID=1411316 RepID=UPI002807A9A9|nr:hypothetical protein [Pedobacter sp.]MDQ8005380.1 hypothetical protein [Pedobacter sp.]